MTMSTFISGHAAEPGQPGQPGSPPRAVGPRDVDNHALVRPGTIKRAANAEPQAHRGRSQAAFHAIAWWLRRALADSARAWALAAGVPPHLYDTPAADEPSAVMSVIDD